MEREVKFRGLPEDPSAFGFDFVYGYYYYDEPVDQHVIYTKKCEVVPVQPETIGQYTGLKDSQGKEIYEGDVLKTVGKKFLGKRDIKTGFMHTEVTHISVVEWWQSSSNLGYRLKNSKGKTIMIKPYAVSRTMKAEKIGNIHQNPELLKQ